MVLKRASQYLSGIFRIPFTLINLRPQP